ncbi:MAG TPA: hypothetical protein PK876_10180 [Elusimicrobiota bacterium]|nr:hypothetical protein [Elusimicrobiota bacterium]
MIPNLRNESIVQAAREAVRVINESSVDYLSRRIPFLSLKLQSNTICAILHNLVARGISELEPGWQLRESGAAGGDLGGPENIEVEIKTSTDKKIKGNRIKLKTGYFICLFVSKPKHDEPLALREVRCGYIQRRDWTVQPKTQFAFINPATVSALTQLYPA